MPTHHLQEDCLAVTLASNTLSKQTRHRGTAQLLETELPDKVFKYAETGFEQGGEFKPHKTHRNGLTIDYEAMGVHLVFLHREIKRRGYDIGRVIFDPKLQPYLFQTQHGQYLRHNIQFSKKPSWVRHDEHYHGDFEIPYKQ